MKYFIINNAINNGCFGVPNQIADETYVTQISKEFEQKGYERDIIFANKKTFYYDNCIYPRFPQRIYFIPVDEIDVVYQSYLINKMNDIDVLIEDYCYKNNITYSPKLKYEERIKFIIN